MFASVNQHCLQRIVDLSERRQVVPSENVVATNGINLWAKDKPMPADIQQRLLQHKLIRPLEMVLSVEQAVSLQEVANGGLELIEENPLLKSLAGTQAAIALLRTLGKVQMQPPVRLLLTVMREHDPAAYRLNLGAMLVALGIAARLQISDRDASVLLMSALLHDFGLLYLNPALLGDPQRLDAEQWKQFAMHPVIGKMIVNELTNLPPMVGECVAMHHERLDGSGYPNYLKRGAIPKLGSWLALADFVSGMMATGGDDVAARICLALRILPEEFDRDAVGVVTQSLRECDDALAGSELDGHVVAAGNLQRLNRTLEIAAGCSGNCATPEQNRVVESLVQRLSAIRQSMHSTGVLQVATQLGDEVSTFPHLLWEISAINREIATRMRSAARDLCFRAGSPADLPDSLQEAVDLLAAAASSSALPLAA